MWSQLNIDETSACVLMLSHNWFAGGVAVGRTYELWIFRFGGIDDTVRFRVLEKTIIGGLAIGCLYFGSSIMRWMTTRRSSLYS